MRVPAACVLVVSALATAACGASPRPVVKAPRTAEPPAPEVGEPEPAPPPAVVIEEHWYFEGLSHDGKRALLRRIDPFAHGTYDTRVVDVDSGSTLDAAALEELGNLPASTIGHVEAAELDAKLAAPSFADDLARGAKIATPFPFGAVGRLSAGPQAIAFNAGDWVYVADASGKVKKRVADVAAYDPRFTPDGKHLLFRRSSGKLEGGVLGKYELFVVPSDLSAAPKALAGTAGAQGRFVVDPDRKMAVVLASREPQIKTCALGVALKPPFAVQKLACLDGGEQLVESVMSPKGRWIAMVTQKKGEIGGGLSWRLRVASLATGKIVFDEPAPAGRTLRAISDAGILVESGEGGADVIDVPGRTKKTREVDVGHRAFFRTATELVYVRGGSVAVLDVRGS